MHDAAPGIGQPLHLESNIWYRVAMKAKATKPAAKKAVPKKPAAKPQALKRITITKAKMAAARSACMGAGKTASAAPQFLPLQPPAFEPVLRTAAQWRSAARAVSK